MIDFPLSSLGLLDQPPRAARPPAAPGYIARPPAAPTQTEQPGLPTSLLAAPERRKQKKLRKPGAAPPAKSAGLAMARSALVPLTKDQRSVAATERQAEAEPLAPSPTAPGDAGSAPEEQQAEMAAEHLDAGFEHTQLEQDLSGLAGQQGIFELLLPNGHTLGVVVQNCTQRTSFLLNPSDPRLGDRLRHNKMELEDRLQRRIRSNVEIAVL